MSKSELVTVKSVPVDVALCISIVEVGVENVTLFVLKVAFLVLFLIYCSVKVI